jgi:predicted Zn-dependent peptidase
MTENLEILLDFVSHPYFTKETVEKEQGIIGEEIKMYDDHAGARLEKGLLEALYKYNKMRIDIAGTQESISKIDADLLYRCYNVFYNLNNMALVVCGDVDVKKVEDVCDKMLKNAPRLEIVRDYEDENEPKEVYKKRSECYLAIAKPIFTIGIKDMDIPFDAKLRTKKISAMHILNDMIFSQSGELYNTLYDSGLISHDLSYSFDMRKGSSYNQIYSESQDPEKVYDIFVKHIKKLQKNGLDKEDFELSKRSIYASFIKSFDSTEEIANNMMYSIFDDADILDTPEIITSVTYEYVSELLNTMFKEEYYAMSVVKPIQQEREEK